MKQIPPAYLEEQQPLCLAMALLASLLVTSKIIFATFLPFSPSLLRKIPQSTVFLLRLSAIHHEGESTYFPWWFSNRRLPVRSLPGKAQWHTSRPHGRTSAAAEAVLRTLCTVQTCSLNNIWQTAEFTDSLLTCLTASPPRQKLPAIISCPSHHYALLCAERLGGWNGSGDQLSFQVCTSQKCGYSPSNPRHKAVAKCLSLPKGSRDCKSRKLPWSSEGFECWDLMEKEKFVGAHREKPNGEN